MLSSSEADLAFAATALASGKLVAFPTETVYGLGADALDPAALARVFEAKRRPTFDPLIVHLHDRSRLDAVADLSALGDAAAARALLLAERLWPGPLTLILPKREAVPELATSGLPTVAVRVPAHPVARRLIELAGRPIAAPRATPFGYLSPTRAEHVRDQLGERVDFIVDGGRCPVGVESTVLDLCSERATILRPGGMGRDRIEELIGPVDALDRMGGAKDAPTAPGQLASHYAPRSPLELYPRRTLSSRKGREGEAFLFFDGASRDEWLELTGGGASAVRVLSERGDSVEAAANLFDLLHELDALGVSSILAERAEETGLGPAINDRLYKARAAAKS